MTALRFIILSISIAESSSTGKPEVEDLFVGRPLTSSPPPWSRVTHSQQPTDLWGNISRPLPTNVWWENLVLGGGDQVANVNPYIIKLLGDGVHVSLPTEVASNNYILSYYHGNVAISASEQLGDHKVVSHDELSVTVRYTAGFEVPLVRGMPYVSVFFTSLTPILKFAHAVLSVTGSGSRYKVSLNNGQEWLVYTAPALSLTQAGVYVSAGEKFTGSVRVACVNRGQGDVDTLDTYSGRIPLGGSISAVASGDMATMRFHWKSSGPGELLMMALPHHLDTLTSPTIPSHSYKVLKGTMIGVTGDVWEFQETLTQITWTAPRAVPQENIADIKAALAEDVVKAHNPGDDPYSGGKKMAVLARLSLIADELGETEIAEQARQRFKPYLEGWLSGTNENRLVYDETWGGVISTFGHRDSSRDFGNGWYNDHHFHFGYHIYTAAVMAKADPSWGAEWEDKVFHMISDVAEPSRVSPWYPFTRVKDWYDGHAWASGIFLFGDAKNQESTSEAVMGWYAIHLWGLATNNKRLGDLGRLMTALEVRAAHKYWQMTNDYSPYSAPFSDHKAVGILWSTKVDYATWFGAHVEYIHCIQMLPFLPISEELLREEWIEEEYPVLKEAYTRESPELSEGWKGYIVMAHAVINPNDAYHEALCLSSYDDGNTRANTLYWISTRPGFDPNYVPQTTPCTPIQITTTTVSIGSSGCCGTNSVEDSRCEDPWTDVHGGLGCNACGIKQCRLCDQTGYIACPQQTGVTTTSGLSSSVSSTTSTTQPPPSGPCCSGGQSNTDPRCGDPSSDPHGGLGCAACGIQTCRFCGYQHWPACL